VWNLVSHSEGGT